MVKGWKILIVDDDEDFIEITRFSLEGRGYRVISAQSGEDGWKMMEKEKPDLVILDLMMEKLDAGMALSQQIKSHPEYRKTPVLMLTSMAREIGLDFSPRSDAEHRELHVDDFCMKPIKMKTLLDKVEKLLQLRRSVSQK